MQTGKRPLREVSVDGQKNHRLARRIMMAERMSRSLPTSHQSWQTINPVGADIASKTDQLTSAAARTKAVRDRPCALGEPPPWSRVASAAAS